MSSCRYVTDIVWRIVGNNFPIGLVAVCSLFNDDASRPEDAVLKQLLIRKTRDLFKHPNTGLIQLRCNRSTATTLLFCRLTNSPAKNVTPNPDSTISGPGITRTPGGNCRYQPRYAATNDKYIGVKFLVHLASPVRDNNVVERGSPVPPSPV
jgi:hypothetical protein